MKLLIVEDEELAVKKLKRLILSVEPEADILAVCDSIRTTVEWLTGNEHPDLVFMDIELADGQSFEIFERVDVRSTVIFTTSYDEHAVKAFKVNTADYLLKPIQKEDIEAAFKKYRKLIDMYGTSKPATNMLYLVKELQQQLNNKDYKRRFLVKNSTKLESINIEDIGYFYSHDGVSFLRTFSGKRHVLDYTMDELEGILDPDEFFRINRAFFITLASVTSIEEYFGSRLILRLKPLIDKEVLVSREKVNDFKKWLGK